LLTEYEKLLNSPSYEVVANTLEKLSMQFPQNAPRYLATTKGVIGAVGRSVEIKWLEVDARVNNEKTSMEKLVDYTNQSYEFRTRVAAAQALKRLDYFSEPLMKNLVNASFSANGRLAGPCNDVLLTFYNQDKYHQMIRDYASGPGWTEWERGVLERLLR
jgi:hypothetical protein